MKCSEERNSTLDYCTTCFRDLSPLVWLHIIHFETSQYADTLRLLDCVGSISVPVGFLNWGIECPLSVTLSVGTVFKDAHVDLLRSEYLTCQVPLSSWDYHVFKMPFIATYCLVKKVLLHNSSVACLGFCCYYFTVLIWACGMLVVEVLLISPVLSMTSSEWALLWKAVNFKRCSLMANSAIYLIFAVSSQTLHLRFCCNNTGKRNLRKPVFLSSDMTDLHAKKCLPVSLTCLNAFMLSR